MIKLFVGLGNPGPQYEATRHNAGFWWVDGLAREWGASLKADKSFHGLVARTTRQGHGVWLLEPMTFMNLSGRAVAALARFYKIQPDEILVAHDELDLPPGQVKLKYGGGHAGHNGLRDIHAQLGTGDYWRLRLGIGHPGVKAEVINWVRSYTARAAAIYAANHPAAVAAHDDYLAGMSWTALERKHGLSDTTLRDHWRKEGLPFQTGRRKVTP